MAASPRRLPSEPPAPDLSHLTEEERLIIQSVLQRQKEEAAKDQQVISNLEKDVKRLEANIQKQVQNQTDHATIVVQGSSGDTCRICNKVKFAGSAGYVCHYCQLKACSRCSGRITLKAKTIWACNLCRKKQELALKTGQWYNGVKGGHAGKLQRAGSLHRQSSFNDIDTGGGEGRQSRGMTSLGAAKRSNSAHALTATDLMGEDGRHQRLRQRLSGEGPQNSGSDVRKDVHDLPRVRLRGEMETTPFIIPKKTVTRDKLDSKKNDIKRQNSFDSNRPLGNQSQKSTVDSHPTRLSVQPVIDPRLNDTSRHQDGVNHSSEQSEKGRAHPVPRLSPHSDKHYQASSDSTIRDRTSSTSSRRSDSSRRSADPGGHQTHPLGSLPGSGSQTGSSSNGHGSTHSVLDMSANTNKRSHDTRRRGSDVEIDQRPRQGSRNREDGHKEDSFDRLSDASQMSRHQRPEPVPRRGMPEPKPRASRSASDENTVEYGGHSRRGSDCRGHTGYATDSHHYSDDYYGRQRERMPGHESNRRLSHDERSQQPVRRGSHDRESSLERGQEVPFRKSAKHIEKREEDSVHGSREHVERNSVLANPAVSQLAVPGSNDSSLENDDTLGDPNKSARSRRREMAMLHADSLSSDPSDCVRPPPPKPHKPRKPKNNNCSKYPAGRQQRDFSSSDDEMRSTTSCGDEVESESLVSEKAPYPGDDSYYDEGTRSDALIAAKIKNFLAHPVDWQRSSDGRYVIGHMILSKTLGPDGQPTKDSGAILGLKVIGGKMTEEGHLGAFITRVKKGSIADTVGHLKPDDEVIEWNGRSLQGATSDEVYEIILESKQEPQVELIVQRRFAESGLPPEMMSRHQGRHHRERDMPNVTITSPGSPGMTRRLMSITHVTGKIQLKMLYTSQSQELVITVLSASELPLVEGNQPPHPYCKIYLLPDRSDPNRRVTRTVPRTREPEWRQTFFFSPVLKSELVDQILEVTVWNLKKSGQSEFLGEIAIDLHSAKFNNEALWYRLRNHDETSSPAPHAKARSVRSGSLAEQKYSPHHKARSRTSDSEISEFSMEDEEAISRSRRPSESSESSRYQHRHEPRMRRESASPSPTPRRRQPLHPGAMPDRAPLRVSRIIVQDASHHQYQQSAASHELDERADDMRRRMGGGRDNYGNYDNGYRDRNGSPHERYYSDQDEHRPNRRRREVSPEEELFMSDASEMSDFSMRSTQSERPRTRRLSEFTSRMESRGHNRRQPPPQTNGFPRDLPPNIYPVHDGSVSDSGVASSLTDRRAGRSSRNNFNKHSGSSGQINSRDTRHRGGREDSHLHDLRLTKLSKQSSKDSTDGSICSMSSDSSNAAMSSAFNDVNRHMQEILAVSNIDRRGSTTSLSTAYEDDLLLAQSTEDSSPMGMWGGYEQVLNPINISARLDESSSIRGNDPRRREVNDIVRVLANPKGAAKPTATNHMQTVNHMPSGFNDQGYSSASSGPSMSGLNLNMKPGMQPTDSSQWAKPRNGSEGLNDFIEGLGPGQVVGRQVLGASCLGDIQMGLSDKKGRLEVEIIRARGLTMKSSAKVLPAPYVKVYLMDGKNCLEKLKTTTARRTLDPFYNQILVFMEPYMQRILQVMVWGDYGRMDRKGFLGVAQVNLDDLDLSNIVFGWYKLFTTSSIVASSGRRSSQSSLDSAYSGSR